VCLHLRRVCYGLGLLKRYDASGGEINPQIMGGKPSDPRHARSPWNWCCAKLGAG